MIEWARNRVGWVLGLTVLISGLARGHRAAAGGG